MGGIGFSSRSMLEMMNAVSTSGYASVSSITLFITLLSACIVFGHLLEENRWINESITALVVGIGTGVVVLLISGGRSSHLLVFSEDLFFIYLLPPIIFNAGFQVKKKHFFRNFSTIMLYGAVGTLISFILISLGSIAIFRKMGLGLSIGDYLAIGTIFAATDSVCTLQVLSQDETPLLYSLVFGESVVNDATSVVLFNAVHNLDLSHVDTKIAFKLVGNFFYLFATSTILGVAAGLLSAYVIKKLVFGRHSTDPEVAIMMLMAYFSYLLAALLNLSSILTVFFCGIVMSHYTWHNVTENSRITTKHTFATLSFLAEISIFLYVGMDALDIEKWSVVSNSLSKSLSTTALTSATLLGLVLVGRAAFVFPLSFLSNLTKKKQSEKVSLRQQVIIWWAGLRRGAVSMALAYNQFTTGGHTRQEGSAIMITSTITVVLFSSVVFGLMTKPMIMFLIPPSKHLNRMISTSFVVPLLGEGQDSVAELFNDNGIVSEDVHSIIRPHSLRMLLTKPSKTVHYHWRKFDNSIMRPVFGGRGFVPYVPGSPAEQSLPHLPEEGEEEAQT